MKLVVEVNFDSAAMIDEPYTELARLLDKVEYEALAKRYFEIQYMLLDSNGNTVGFFKWEV